MPVRVEAHMHFGKWHDIEVEDDVTAYVEYENGATGTFVTTTGDVPGSNPVSYTHLSGIAGVYTALELGGDCDITIITKEEVEISNSVLAQGGIAVSLDKNDSPEEHMKDTLRCV